ncbi:MAG: DUF3577 domain-containing protein [Pseudomonadota bacterium]
MSTSETKYFDLYTTGIGYLSRVREITNTKGNPFLSITLAALRGNADDAQYTHFDCVVSGQQAKDLVRQLQPAVDGDCKVLVGFLLNDLYGQPFVFQNGDKAGEAGVNLKARLLRIEWAKVDGKPVYTRRAA